MFRTIAINEFIDNKHIPPSIRAAVIIALDRWLAKVQIDRIYLIQKHDKWILNIIPV